LSRKSLHRHLFSGWDNAETGAMASWLRYAVVTSMVALALGVRIFLLPAQAQYAFLAFYPAVALAALLPGAGPTLFALCVSLVAGIYFYEPPFGLTGQDKAAPTFLFFLFTIAIYYVCNRISRDRAHASASKRLLQTIFESNPDALLVIDSNRHIVMANRQASALLGYEHGDLSGCDFAVIIPERLRANHPILRLGGSAKGAARGQVRAEESHVKRRDGQEIEVEINLSRLKTDQGPLVSCSLRDIRARNKAEAELRISATAFESNEGIIVTDADGVIQRINLAFTRISGYTLADLVGKTTDMLRSNRHDKDFYRAMLESIRETGGWQGEVWGRRKNGEEYPEWLNISAVKNKDGKVTHYVGSHADITERKQAEAEIKDLAFFDQLTGLPNRTLFADRLKQTIRASSHSGNYGALLFIDLDNFKELNDTMGHDVGDKLLRQVAKRLIALAREVDIVARLGGDEFVVILANLSAIEREAVDQAQTIAEKTLDSLRLPYTLGEVTYASTASVGATLFREKRDTFEELMKQADLAMYKSKAVGRNTVRFFDPTMEAAIMERARLEKDLRHGLAHRHFAVFYQAQVAGEGYLIGAEALVRWHHPERGVISPKDFIQVAEESGLILPLGHWVLETACRQLAAWSGNLDMAHLTIAVNVSASQFRQHDFVDQILDVLETTGANPMRLKLELTESLLVDDVPTVIEKMNALKNRGVGFALDDFGTGYSSLSYLKRMPLVQLKIDQSFVRDVLTDPSDAAIAKTIVALARSLDLSVIAEGVETEAQRDFLAQNGCHDYQGYLFSVPLPIEEFEQFAMQHA
jgi:diguanylate cyclase (GGDEF)-like protein/PAS domain S-box-containing protein